MKSNEGFTRIPGHTQTVVIEIDPEEVVGETHGDRKHGYNERLQASSKAASRIERQPCQQEVVNNPNGSYVLDISHEERSRAIAAIMNRKPPRKR